ncbi:MAG: protein-export chaperone SecB [Saprospiraceae bacterium]|nr:protein-export chaperone SecB [Saprospiraceae bacterium]
MTIDSLKIVMEVNLNVENIFNLSLLAIGEFRHSEAIDEKMKLNFVNTNAPAIVFPYVRSYISTLTSLSGSQISTIILPPQIFKGQLEEIAVDKLNKF